MEDMVYAEKIFFHSTIDSLVLLDSHALWQLVICVGLPLCCLIQGLSVFLILRVVYSNYSAQAGRQQTIANSSLKRCFLSVQLSVPTVLIAFYLSSTSNKQEFKKFKNASVMYNIYYKHCIILGNKKCFCLSLDQTRKKSDYHSAYIPFFIYSYLF